MKRKPVIGKAIKGALIKNKKKTDTENKERRNIITYEEKDEKKGVQWKRKAKRKRREAGEEDVKWITNETRGS